MRGWLRRLERSRVIVHTKDDRSIRGVLVGVWPDCVVLSSAEYLADTVTPLDGDPVIPRENVAWLQRLAAHG